MKISRWFLREHEGEIIKPPWMGIAYHHFDTDVEVLYLIPFNFIIAWIRNLYCYIRYQYSPFAWEKKLYAARAAGYRSALEQRQWLDNDRLRHEDARLQKAREDGFVSGCDATVRLVEMRIKGDV